MFVGLFGVSLLIQDYWLHLSLVSGTITFKNRKSDITY